MKSATRSASSLRCLVLITSCASSPLPCSVIVPAHGLRLLQNIELAMLGKRHSQPNSVNFSESSVNSSAGDAIECKRNTFAVLICEAFEIRDVVVDAFVEVIDGSLCRNVSFQWHSEGKTKTRVSKALRLPLVAETLVVL